MIDIPFMRLDRQFEQHKSALLNICEQVFSHGRVLQGPEVDALENQLCEIMGTKRAIAVGSATDALFFALISAGVSKGDRVAVPAMTFVATVSPIIRAGAIPVFVDARLDSQPDTEQIINLVESGNIEAVVAAHLYGQMFDITPIVRACKTNDVLFIEDAAQAIGATFNGSSPGKLSSAATVSFDPMKVAGAFGSGGAVVTNDDNIADRVHRLRYHGRDHTRAYQELGYNSQISSIQAAIVSFKLNHIDEWTERRQQIARQYSSILDEISSVTHPIENPETKHVFHKYVLMTGSNRDRLSQHLLDSGIGTMVHYPRPLYREPIFSKYVTDDDRFPQADRISKEALSLPIYPELESSEVDYICEQLTKFSW